VREAWSGTLQSGRARSGLNVPIQRPLRWIFCCSVFTSLELIGPTYGRRSEQREQGLQLLPNFGASKTGGVWKFSDFPALSVNISKTIADTAKVTISDYEVIYGLSIDAKIDDLG